MTIKRGACRAEAVQAYPAESVQQQVIDKANNSVSFRAVRRVRRRGAAVSCPSAGVLLADKCPLTAMVPLKVSIRRRALNRKMGSTATFQSNSKRGL